MGRVQRSEPHTGAVVSLGSTWVERREKEGLGGGVDDEST